MSLDLTKASARKKHNVHNGVHMARVVQIIDLGQQIKTHWKTGEVETYDDGNTILQDRCQVAFELPNAKVLSKGTERPSWVFKEYTVSTHEKAGLTELITAVNPATEGLKPLLAGPCMVTIGKTSGGNDKIMSVVGVPQGMSVPELDNPCTYFDMDDWDDQVFGGLPKWIQEKIQNAENYLGPEVPKTSGTPAEKSPDSDVPGQDVEELF